MQAADIEITVLNDAEINLANDFFNSIYKSGMKKNFFGNSGNRPRYRGFTSWQKTGKRGK